jgi:hypothetical protein
MLLGILDYASPRPTQLAPQMTNFSARTVSIDVPSTSGARRRVVIDIEFAASLLVECLVGYVVTANPDVLAEAHFGCRWRSLCDAEPEGEEEHKTVPHKQHLPL